MRCRTEVYANYKKCLFYLGENFLYRICGKITKDCVNYILEHDTGWMDRKEWKLTTAGFFR